jgi:hypothetical protein
MSSIYPYLHYPLCALYLPELQASKPQPAGYLPNPSTGVRMSDEQAVIHEGRQPLL